MNDRVYYLLGKMLSGECSEEELEELVARRVSNIEVNFYIEEISRWWNQSAATTGGQSVAAFEKHWQKLKDEGFLSPSAERKNREQD